MTPNSTYRAITILGSHLNYFQEMAHTTPIHPRNTYSARFTNARL